MKKKDWRDELIALLDGLNTQHIDLLMSSGKVEDFRHYGEAYHRASIKDKDKNNGVHTLNREVK